MVERMEWALHRTVERQASRMHEMMKRLDVDAPALVRQKNGEVYAVSIGFQKGPPYCLI